MPDFPFITPGLPDSCFRRQAIPLTRQEVRVVALAKLRLAPGQVFWDVGTGTGAVAVEAARLIRPEGKVYAVERDPERVAVARANASSWELDNLAILEGEAPEALLSLPSPHRVFVGGSGGKLGAILKVVGERLLPGGRVAITGVTLDTLWEAYRWTDALGWEAELLGMMLVRGEKVGSRCLLKGGNPIFLVVAEKPGEGR
ncbi:precorrin-6Y C5,15-methyltransferase (decarboxylating) subunit CbiT [Ammonifex thiophilus]|uniref:precorrin-6Y C5,15-methyltransferase (decarboxylating) subunit CbiT n=1 Tax=Ammonifex thiophilus TaxID=444093 RepID=UPI00140335F6|nr:precorrin-6Y C5,15-methyltransferase (decarboxylating) subunit CbiT [Ammonifex thiophilus]